MIECFAKFYSYTIVMAACAEANFIDAEAICAAASRPAMRFVAPTMEAQQTLPAPQRACHSYSTLIWWRLLTLDDVNGTPV
ncbi:hypothetical protein NC77_02230 [Janthinobacterium lividum]|nr:hypothetical protein NC77_02230 [Janthinobacterium lividum]